MEPKSSSEKEATLYSWAFRTGMIMLRQLEQIYGDNADKRLYTQLLTLRSEELPARFRRQLANMLIEMRPGEISFPPEVREERIWSIDEYYRYSTAILAGFYDAIRKWREDKEKEKQKESEGGAPSG
ncbi:hypothetical protein ATG_15370 [Desulfurococcaceae archaeon AG1]|nr:hypothetical protein ATG_15370 [Desulfurococcaceae archaeon AG1]